MLEYDKNKAKFRPYGEPERKFDEWGQIYYKQNFIPTTSYMKYLHEKQREQDKLEIATLRNKLEYQQKTYGEVDELDVQNYMSLVQRFYKVYNERVR